MRDNLFLTSTDRMAILKRECDLLSARFLTEPAGGGTENIDKGAVDGCANGEDGGP